MLQKERIKKDQTQAITWPKKMGRHFHLLVPFVKKPHILQQLHYTTIYSKLNCRSTKGTQLFKIWRLKNVLGYIGNWRCIKNKYVKSGHMCQR